MAKELGLQVRQPALVVRKHTLDNVVLKKNDVCDTNKPESWKVSGMVAGDSRTDF